MFFLLSSVYTFILIVYFSSLIYLKIIKKNLHLYRKSGFSGGRSQKTRGEPWAKKFLELRGRRLRKWGNFLRGTGNIAWKQRTFQNSWRVPDSPGEFLKGNWNHCLEARNFPGSPEDFQVPLKSSRFPWIVPVSPEFSSFHGKFQNPLKNSPISRSFPLS